MPLPIVAIVGRPNVGKSSLLNVIARRQISIVEPTPGVTRDRISTIVDADDSWFELVDTGGYGIVDRQNLTEHVERQIFYAIEQANIILFVVDARDGVTPLDQAVAEKLRPYAERVVLVANKVDDIRAEPVLGEFHALGFGEPLPVSALHAHGKRELLERILERLPAEDAKTPPRTPAMKIAIVGRRNTGKSTFINALAGEERVIVSETPGTTRDAVDVRIEKDGRTLVVIDTAGVRKKSKFEDDIEFYGYTRATRAIHRADVVLLFIDSTDPISVVDKKLAGLIAEEHRPVLIVVNKWDLALDAYAAEGRVPPPQPGPQGGPRRQGPARGETKQKDYEDYLDKTLPEIDYAPVAFASARENRNVLATIDRATALFKQANLRVATGRLNEALREILAERGPSAKRGTKAPKIYYATQISAAPPTIVLFVNHPGLVTQDYQRFLLNRFRERLPFGQIPIRLVFRASRGRVAGEATVDASS
jgi:GTP-binding protein